MVERSTSHYCVTMTKNTEKESRYQSTSLFGGGGGSGILYQNTICYHIIIVYCKGYEPKKPKAYPKLSQATQEVASVRGLSLVKYSILTICCCSVVVRSSLNHSRQDKGSFSKKTKFIDNNITSYLFYS